MTAGDQHPRANFLLAGRGPSTHVCTAEWARKLRARTGMWLGPPQPAAGVVVVFGWTSLIAAIYLFARVITRAAA